MNEKINKNIETLRPFTKILMTIGELPTSYLMSMTYYEQIIWFTKYLQEKVIPAINTNAEAVQELQNLFTELQNYVNTYFDNLDVQDEINNKLDEMAESGELERIISEYFEGDIQVIFPEYGAEGSDTLGDCSIIKNEEYSLMIDTFTGTSTEPACYQKIREALYNAEISTLSYLVITHYHGDHIGNVLNLLNDGYLAGCTVYLPRVCTSYPTLNGNDIKTALTSAGITWIEIDNQSFTVGEDLTVQLRNGSATDYAYYENLAQTDPSYNNTYNDRSVVCDITYKDKHLLFTGDLETRGCDYVTDKLSSSSYDLLKACHHGYIANAPSFCSRVNADYVIVPASIGMVNKNYTDWLNNVTYWVRKSKNVAIQGYQNEDIILNIDKIGIHTDSTYFVNDLSCDGTLTYFVDANSADNIRTGSINHPFKTLNEAMIFTPKDMPEEVRINIKSLPVTNNDVKIIGYSNIRLVFDNGITFNKKITINNCKHFYIENLNQTNDSLNINQSTGNIKNYTNSNGDNSINIYQSKVIFENNLNLTIDTNNAIVVRYNSEVTFNNPENSITLTYAEDTTKRLFSAYFSTIYFNNYTINTLKNLPFHGKILDAGSLSQVKFSENVINLLTLFQENTNGATTGELKEDITHYNNFLVDYVDNDGYRKIERFSRWEAHELSISRITSSACYTKCAKLEFSEQGTFSLTNNRQITIKTGSETNSIQSGNFILVKGIYAQPPLY